MDITGELKSIENTLRDTIAYVLKNKYGDRWEENLKLTQDRMDTINMRMTEEASRLKGIQLDTRLLYYSDFYDLKSIILKNWDIFIEIFKNKKDTEIYLEKLESFRNPEAHRRELLSFQENLVLGIVGELKMKIINYRGDKENLDTYFPKVESVQVNDQIFQKNIISLTKHYHVGDQLEIRIQCLVPPNMEIKYSNYHSGNYRDSNRFIVNLTKSDIGKDKSFRFFIKSNAEYHSRSMYDDSIQIFLTVLPN